MESQRLKHTKNLTDATLNKVAQTSEARELTGKIHESYRSVEGEIDSPFEKSIRYVSEHFSRQADGLRAISEINDKSERRKKFLPILRRRKEILENVVSAVQAESFSDLERTQVLWFYDVSTAFINQLSKELSLFNEQYTVSGREGSILSNMTTAEMQQNLAQTIVKAARTALPAEKERQGKTSEVARLAEEEAFSLFHKMSTRALGLSKGNRLYNAVENGVYGAAAAFLLYSNPALNRFGKSFTVRFPSPYLDAIEQTDLILVDEDGIPETIRQEISVAFEQSTSGDKNAIDDLSPEAKQRIYKVQVKCREGGSSDLTSEEQIERDRFLSARCTSKGFDKGDYLVLTAGRAHAIVEHARKEARL